MPDLCLCYNLNMTGIDSRSKRKAGFTIVELLIVIVVIAILAAITIILYNNMQERAQASKLGTAASTYKKLLEMHRQEHGKYPIGTACLTSSQNLVAQSGFAANECEKYSDGSSTYINTSLNNTLKKYSANLPEGDYPSISSTEVGLNSRAMTYSSYDGNAASILYLLKGSHTCPQGWTGEFSDGITECYIQLDGLPVLDT